ncbi:sulfatase [Gordonia sinesedis]
MHHGWMPADNVILIHWHDLGRHLTCYGAQGVSSPCLDDLAAHGIRFTDAHATAPLCSPARGSLFTGQYPHHNGLVGLAHHGFEYHDGVHTLPALLGAAGYRTVLYGMQHESADPTRLGFDTVDVSESRCDYVVARAQEWLAGHTADPDGQPFFLTAGFFETHRPYPADEYPHADPGAVGVPGFLPDTPTVREDLAGLHGSIAAADAAVGRLLDTVAELGLADSTWIVFITDHGLAFPRAKSTLYAEGTGVALIVRPPARRRISPRVYDDLFSGVDLTPTVLDLLSVPIPDDVDGYSHATEILSHAGETVRDRLFTEKTYHDAFDPIRAIRTKDFSYIENYADRPAHLLPLDIADSLSAESVPDGDTTLRRARAELYDLRADPYERTNLVEDPDYVGVAQTLAAALAQWRTATADVLPDDSHGTAIAERFMAEFRARAELIDPADEALPSRRPEGSRRELAGDVTAGVG